MESEVDNLYDQEYDESGLLTWEVEEEESKGKEKASEGDSLEGSSEGIQIEEGEGKRGKEKEEEEHISHLNQGGGGLPTHLCSICYDNVTQAQFIWMSGCGHGFCRDCMITYIKTTMKEGDILECPHFTERTGELCKEPIRDQVISRLFIDDKGLLREYTKHKEMVVLRSNPNCRWCPREGCGAGNIGEGGEREGEVVVCCQCGYEFCFDCGEDAHPNQTCQEFRENAIKTGKIDKKAEKWKKKKKTKPCPQCKSAIEKDVGCNHMKCANCHYQFCWLCMRKYTPDHYDADNWENGCPNQCFDFVEPLSERVKNTAKKGAIYTGVAIGSVFVIALAIPVVIVGGPFYLGYKAYKKTKRN